MRRHPRLCLSFLAVAAAISLRDAAGEEQQPHTEDRRALLYPKRIAIPDDIPATFWTHECPGKSERELVFPVAIYSITHFAGWQMLLRDFAIDGKNISQCVYEQPLVTLGGELFSTRGWKDGYAAAHREISRRLKQNSEKSVRQFAGRAYHGRSQSPPPRRADDPPAKERFVPGHPRVGQD